MASALEARELYGSMTDLMEWDAYVDGLGPEPPAPDETVLEVAAEGKASRRRLSCQPRRKPRLSRDAKVMTEGRRAQVTQALETYDGPASNKMGYPKQRALTEHAGFLIRPWEKRECWDEL